MKKTKPVLTLEELKKMCNKDMFKIAAEHYMTKDEKKIRIRYLDFNGHFGYTCYGHFFFIEDCMYIISEDEKYAVDHNPDIIEMHKDLAILKLIGGYIVRVIFAGFLTGFKDDYGNNVYTGDVIDTRVIITPDFPSKGGFYRAKMEEDFHDKRNHHASFFSGVAVYQNDYQIVMDNCSCPLSWANTIIIIGNIFFNVSMNNTEINIFGECSGLAQSRNRANARRKIMNAPTIIKY